MRSANQSFSEGQPSLCFCEEQLEERMRLVDPNDSITVDFHTLLRGTEYLSLLRGRLNEIFQETALRLKTIKHFKKIWYHNFKANKQYWLDTPSVSKVSVQKPDFFILGGPSVDQFFDQDYITFEPCIWSADTALMPLIDQKKYPDLVFSIDPGFGSFEHYSYIKDKIKHKMTFILDPLSFPGYYRLDTQKYTYASNHPLIQRTKNPHPVLRNQAGDVFGIMVSVHQLLFPDKKLPTVLGHDQKAFHGVTHLRGSAYHQRQYHRTQRTETTELYFHRLSKKYR